MDNTILQLNISVPDKKTKQEVLLPLLRELTQKAQDLAVAKLIKKNVKISCAKGCSECCYQLIPVSQLEARYLCNLVTRMPKVKRQMYKARFEQTFQRLQNSQIIDELMNSENIADNITEFALKYFQLGIPCPFLEGGSCSIYPERPLRCREYLVTNDAVHCSNPTKDTIRRVEYPVYLSKFLTKVSKPWTKYPNDWIPLSLIMAWANQHPDEATLRNSQDWINDALTALSSQQKAINEKF